MFYRYRNKKDWSDCSKEYLEEGLKLGLGSCLMNVPKSTNLWGGPQCGNEIIEKGEECDCGSVAECTRYITYFLNALMLV